MMIDQTKAIIRVNYKGKQLQIKVFQNGNPAYTGAILKAKYRCITKILELMKQGDIVRLGENIYPNPNKAHFYMVIKGKCYSTYLQDKVTIVCNRDIQYRDCRSRYLFDANDFEDEWLYEYDVKKGEWVTYLKYAADHYVCKENLWYKNYITNLLMMDDLSDLSKAEKRGLEKEDILVKY